VARPEVYQRDAALDVLEVEGGREEEEMQSGFAYVSVHTTALRDGMIRAQIQLH
jgi:hypothetical protein